MFLVIFGCSTLLNTAAECTLTYFRNTFRYHDACQAGAILECPPSDFRNAFRHHDACQTNATPECTLTYFRNAFRYHDACQANAISVFRSNRLPIICG